MVYVQLLCANILQASGQNFSSSGKSGVLSKFFSLSGKVVGFRLIQRVLGASASDKANQLKLMLKCDQRNYGRQSRSPVTVETVNSNLRTDHGDGPHPGP